MDALVLLLAIFAASVWAGFRVLNWFVEGCERAAQERRRPRYSLAHRRYGR
jgi:hypothetical protein